MQTASSRNQTQVTISISYNNNHNLYATEFVKFIMKENSLYMWKTVYQKQFQSFWLVRPLCSVLKKKKKKKKSKRLK